MVLGYIKDGNVIQNEIDPDSHLSFFRFQVEQGNPRILLEDQSSIFFSFAKASNVWCISDDDLGFRKLVRRLEDVA